MESLPLWMPFVFFAIAVVYASAGFGGGTAYLAAMALSGAFYQWIPQTALICNVIVGTGGVWHYYRGGHLDVKRILPFFVMSIPMAYLGGRLHVGKEPFFLLLGLSLLFAGARMMMPRFAAPRRETISASYSWLVGLPVGAAIGFLSGIVGIGGGVFLAPVLLLAGWTTPKQTAAATSLFIILNSISGLAGHVTKGFSVGIMIIPLALAVFIGGQIGSRAGSYRLPAVGVRRVVASIIIVVGLKLLWRMI